MEIKATPRYEEFDGGKSARIWIDVTVDTQQAQSQVFVSGPQIPVKDYFEGTIDFYALSNALLRRG